MQLDELLHDREAKASAAASGPCHTRQEQRPSKDVHGRSSVRQVGGLDSRTWPFGTEDGAKTGEPVRVLRLSR